ncbi:GntR family transcriptional regulator [Rhodococcus sp. NPDC079359]|uniref:GntR family transcriptional regulator n=1 Tax=Rhodococcus sp. NPDC079359 TaxID=3154961 RepID=UPI0034500BED
MSLSLSLDSRTLVTQITDKLREQIITGKLAPGDRIRQDAYAEAFGVSRTPLREAFRLLESEGWIQLRARSGVEVSRFSPVEVQEILSMRLLLEPLAIRVSAVGHADDSVPALTSLLEQLPSGPSRSVEEVEVYEAANQKFHYALYGLTDASTDEPLHTSLRSHWERYSRYRRVYYRSDSESTSHSNEEHVQILEAWQSRDADRAEAELARHILSAGRSLVRALGDNDRPSFLPTLTALAGRYDFDLA